MVEAFWNAGRRIVDEKQKGGGNVRGMANG
jgi:hypothetical protein